MRMDTWEWRAKLGILVIHNDPVPESEIWTMAPRGVTVHAARFDSPTRSGAEYTGADWRSTVEVPDMTHALDQLGQMGLDAICLCFGSSSFFGGAEFDAGFTAEASRIACGTPVFTAAQAMAGALRASGMRRLRVAMPPWFTPPTFEATRTYLAEAGFEVDELVHFDLGDSFEGVQKFQLFDRGGRWQVRPDQVFRQLARPLPAGTDGVLIPGSGFRSLEAIEPLERELGAPVITSNQACLWHFLQITGVDAGRAGPGSLFGAAQTAARIAR